MYAGGILNICFKGWVRLKHNYCLCAEGLEVVHICSSWEGYIHVYMYLWYSVYVYLLEQKLIS